MEVCNKREILQVHLNIAHFLLRWILTAHCTVPMYLLYFLWGAMVATPVCCAMQELLGSLRVIRILGSGTLL